MVVKVKKNFTLSGLPNDILKEFQKGAGKKVIRKIKSTIKKGLSPVEGHGRFQRYSQSYRDAINGKVSFRFSKKLNKVLAFKSPDPVIMQWGKRASPVNMTLSGSMMETLISTNIRSGVKFEFTSPIARYHDVLGAGKSRVIRRLLPSRGGENFITPIDDLIAEVMIDAVSKAINRQLRGGSVK